MEINDHSIEPRDLRYSKFSTNYHFKKGRNKTLKFSTLDNTSNLKDSKKLHIIHSTELAEIYKKVRMQIFPTIVPKELSRV